MTQPLPEISRVNSLQRRVQILTPDKSGVQQHEKQYIQTMDKGKAGYRWRIASSRIVGAEYGKWRLAVMVFGNTDPKMAPAGHCGRNQHYQPCRCRREPASDWVYEQEHWRHQKEHFMAAKQKQTAAQQKDSRTLRVRVSQI